MAILARKKSKKEQAEQARRRRRRMHGQLPREVSLGSQLFALLLVVMMTFFVTIICFVGISPAGPRVTLNETARFRITAKIPFSYVSQVEAARYREAEERKVRPVYRIDMEAFEAFSAKIATLRSAMAERLEPAIQGLPTEEQQQKAVIFSRELAAENGFMVNYEDALLLTTSTTAAERAQLFDEGLLHLKEILRDGVYQSEDLPAADNLGIAPILNVEILDRRGVLSVESEANAASTLRMNLTGLGDELTVSRALYRILRRGLEPNLIPDKEAYQAKLSEALSKIRAPIINVREGEILIDQGARVTPAKVEMLDAYRTQLELAEEIPGVGLGLTVVKRVLLTFVLMVIAALYWSVRLEKRREGFTLALQCCLILLFNLSLLRLVYELSDLELFAGNAALLSALPYTAPLVLGPIILCIMAGIGQAILVAIVISVLYGLMLGNSMTIFVITLLSCMVAIYFSRDVRARGKLARAGAMAGLTIAIAVGFHGLANEIDPGVVWRQSFAGFTSGLLSGIVAIGLLPTMENLFRRTTNITLLELTDFNHPLLRKLQIAAPGTYHHSLMVANLAERAASEIGANATLCRATCLFHDIGKIVKPEFFVEIQREGHNPHDQLSPSMSALIIKTHVKEGLEMAQEAKLPQVIIDVIEQHHGTTLIKYFYNRAVERRRQPSLGIVADDTKAPMPSADASEVDEAAYRYEGPRPRFKESAIIFFADAIEAASRSLKKVNPQNVEEMVGNIMRDRIEDGQLDEAPITMSELGIIRESFEFTLMNMLHSRVEYPKSRVEKKRETVTPPPMPLKEQPHEA